MDPLGSRQVEINIQLLIGRKHTIKTSRDATVLDLKAKIQDLEHISPNQMRLIFGGKEMLDYNMYDGNTRARRPLSYYNVQKGSTIHLVLKLGNMAADLVDLPSLENATRSRDNWKGKATEGDFDEDLHIVDPKSHFELLKELQRDTYERSKGWQDVDVIRHMDMKLADEMTLKEAGFSASLRAHICERLSLYQENSALEPVLQDLGHLLTSLSIISNATQSLDQMSRRSFCTSSINILVNHTASNIVEIKPIPIQMIESIRTNIEAAVSLILKDLSDPSVTFALTGLVLPSSLSLIRHLGLDDLPKFPITPSSSMLTFIRKIVLLTDHVIVSYVTSHGPASDPQPIDSQEVDVLIDDGNDYFAFNCYWVRLACLNDFLDKRKVRMFHLFNKFSTRLYQPTEDKERSHRSMSILTRMEDLADIWGPVYTVPSTSGLVRYYEVSKGVVCRVKANEQSAVLGAAHCHYFSRRSFMRHNTSRLLHGDKNLYLSENELLLIGAGLRENQGCHYKISDLTEQVSSDLTPLGTSEAAWRTESRSWAVGISKYIGVTISGTQKLIPQTTLKQHVLGKWTSNPSRANPGILNQALGVEISHCTGNGRRTPLRELMITKPICSVLERQNPDWTKTPWGSDFAAALQSDDGEEIFYLWGKHASHRPEIANLVCGVLEFLDSTGWDETNNFHSAIVFDNKESALKIPAALNDWLAALKDTHLTAAYVITNEVCLDCEVPDHSTSTCQSVQAYTVLQTQLAMEKRSIPKRTDSFLLPTFGRPLQQVDCGTSSIPLFAPITPTMFRYGRQYSCLEHLDRTGPATTWNMVYLRASKQSCHGKRECENASTGYSSRFMHLHRRRGRRLHPDRPTAHERGIDDVPENPQNQNTSLVNSVHPGNESEAPAIAPLWSGRSIVRQARDEGLIASDVLGQENYDFIPYWGGGPSAADVSRL